VEQPLQLARLLHDLTIYPLLASSRHFLSCLPTIAASQRLSLYHPQELKMSI